MKETNNSESISLYDLPFSVRALNLFHQIPINNLDELTTYSVSDLLRYRNCGKRTIAEIVNVLGSIGLTLKKPITLKAINISKEALLEKLEKIRTLLERIEASIQTL